MSLTIMGVLAFYNVPKNFVPKLSSAEIPGKDLQEAVYNFVYLENVAMTYLLKS